MDQAFHDAITYLAGLAEAERLFFRFSPLEASFFGDISNKEALAFYLYTTAQHHHKIINAELWSGYPSGHVAAIAAVLNQGLGKLQPFRARDAELFRGYNADDLDAFSAKYKPGTIVPFAGFTSAARSMDSAYFGNVMFTIRPLNARVIYYVSADFHEDELLFPSGCRFRVLDNERNGNRLAILLEEV